MNHSLNSSPSRVLGSWAIARMLLSLTAAALLAGCGVYDCKRFSSGSSCQEPIYLSWEKFRAPLEFDETGTMAVTTPGANGYYQDTYLVVEKYVGIHYFDASNLSNITKIGFFPVIGAEDFKIKGDWLYVRAFTDLVIYDLSNRSMAPERVRSVFKQDEYRFISEYRSTEPYQEDNGLIIGYSKDDDEGEGRIDVLFEEQG